MPSRPAVALVLLQAEWFDSVVALPALREMVAGDSAEIVDQLGKDLTIANHWMVNSPASLEICRQELRLADCDLVILAFQVWAEDFYLMPLLESIGSRKLAVWCYVPWNRPPRPASFLDFLRGSGPVGTFEGMGTLRNLGIDYHFVYGAPSDPRLQTDLLQIARAAQAVNELRSARFGILPGRNEQMQSTFVDEFRLRAELGPQVEPLSVAELADCAAALPDSAVQEFITELNANFPIQGVSSTALQQAARSSLGLAQLAVEHKLDLISLNDISPELHRVLGLRPCLYPSLYERRHILSGLEGDLGAAVAVFVQDRLLASPLLFVEFWYWDEAENVLVGGHAGVQNPAVGVKPWITQDYEFCQTDASEGAHYQFVAKPGRVTLLQLRGTPQGWQALAAGGECIATDPWLEGYPHAVIRLDVPIGRFLNAAAAVGVTQHFVMAYGDDLPEIEILCKMLKIPLVIPT